MLPEERLDPTTGEIQRTDSGMKRWIRGYMKKPIWNTFDVLFGLASLATGGLGLWASVLSMEAQFKASGITPFTCKNPAGSS